MEEIINEFCNIISSLAKLPEQLNRIEAKLSALSPDLQEKEELLTVKEVAELTHLAVNTIYNLCSQRKIPHSKCGKRLYFSKSNVTSWILDNRQKTSDELRKEAIAYFESSTKKKKNF